MNLNMVCGHVDIGGEHRSQKQSQSPSGQGKDAALRSQQTHAAEQLEDAAGKNGIERKGDEGRHDGKEECGIGEMYRASKEKK